ETIAILFVVLNQAGGVFWTREALAREKEVTVTLSDEGRLTVSERALQGHPSGKNAQIWSGITPRSVEGLVLHAAEHLLRETPTLIGRSPADESRYSCHACFARSSSRPNH